MASMRPGLRVALAALMLAACARTPAAAPSGPSKPPGYEEIAARAEADGVVRVIMRVEVAPGDASPLMGRSLMMADLGASGAAMAAPLTDDLPFVVAELTPAQLETVAESGRVAAMIEDRLTFVNLDESVRQIRAPEVWRLGGLGRGQAVAVLDTGVDAKHPFFGGRVVAEACFSSSSPTFNAEVVCPGGKGEEIGAGAAKPCDTTGCEHGTHVAGIAAGSGQASRGVAPQADIIAVQVFSRFRDGPSRTPCASSGQRSPCIASFTSDQIRALDHVRTLAADRPIAAVNMSLGGGRSTGACDGDFIAAPILALKALGVVTVIAAGNDGARDAVSFPGCVAGAVTVGAVDRADAIASFSNRGPLVDVYAPGVGVRSAVTGGGFAAFSGTSMAAPHVAGAIAALRSARPGVDAEAVTFALASTGKSIDDRRRIDVAAALAAIRPAVAAAPPTLTLAAIPPEQATVDRAIKALASRPADESIRMLVRPRWAAQSLTSAAQAEAVERVAQAARDRGARLVDPRPGQGLVVVEATPAQLTALARSGMIGAMQEEVRALPTDAPARPN